MIHEATTLLPTELGTFTINIYKNSQGQDVTAISSGKLNGQNNVAVRVHSACFTAEALGSLKCDCKQQLDFALDYIAENGGVVLYLPQEGRGIGLSNKIKAYALQEQGYDTIEANRLLGLPIDSRSYEDARDILNDLNIESIRLLTNNPLKLKNLSELGVNVSGRIPIASKSNAYSEDYLKTKQKHMGHMIKAENDSHVPLIFPEKTATKRPYIHVNFAINNLACTSGGEGESISISCNKDWQRVHELREKYSAVAVGANTWINDSPKLTARSNVLGREAEKQPARVIFSGLHKCKLDLEQPNRKTFFVGKSPDKFSKIYNEISSDGHDLAPSLAKLYEQNIKSMLVEGGLKLIDSFIKQNMVDLLTIYVRSTCITTAINLAIKAIPDLAADQIEAQSYGAGILLTVALNNTLCKHTDYEVAI